MDKPTINPETEGGRNSADRALFEDVDFAPNPNKDGQGISAIPEGFDFRSNITVQGSRSDGSRAFDEDFSKAGIKATHTDYNQTGLLPTLRKEYAQDGKTLTRSVEYDLDGKPATVTNYMSDGV